MNKQKSRNLSGRGKSHTKKNKERGNKDKRRRRDEDKDKREITRKPEKLEQGKQNKTRMKKKMKYKR